MIASIHGRKLLPTEEGRSNCSALGEELGLPVRRLAQGKLGAVFAYKHELDAWWQHSQSKLAVEEDNAKEEADSSEADLIIEQRVLDPVEEDNLADDIRPDELRRNRVRLYGGVISLSVLGLGILLIAWGPQIIEWIRGPKPR